MYVLHGVLTYSTWISIWKLEYKCSFKTPEGILAKIREIVGKIKDRYIDLQWQIDDTEIER